MSSTYLPSYGSPTWKAPVTNEAALPATNNSTGDARVALAEGTLWYWDGSAWAELTGGGGGSTSQTNLGNKTGSFNIDLSVNTSPVPNYICTLTGASTLTVSNPTAGAVYYIEWVQDGTGGWTLALPTNFQFTVFPGWSTAPYFKNAFLAYYDGTDYVCTAMPALANSGHLTGVGPANLTGCTAWYDPASGITQSSNLVSAWACKALVGPTAAQATGAWQPTYVSSGINGQPILRFSNGQILDLGAGAMINSGQPFSLYMVFQNTTFPGTPFPSMINLKNDGANVYTVGLSTSGAYKDIYFGSDSGTTFYDGTSGVIPITTTPHSLLLMFSGSSPTSAGSFTLYVDWNLISIGANGGLTTSTNHGAIGADWLVQDVSLVSWSPFGGDLGDIALFNTVLTTGKRMALQTYSCNRWGV